MDRTDYGAIVKDIGAIFDMSKLSSLLGNPRYAGFTKVIEDQIAEVRKGQQIASQQQGPQPAMARGGIIAFKHGGAVRKFATGTSADNPITPGYDPSRLYGSGPVDPTSLYGPSSMISGPDIDNPDAIGPYDPSRSYPLSFEERIARTAAPPASFSPSAPNIGVSLAPRQDSSTGTNVKKKKAEGKKSKEEDKDNPGVDIKYKGLPTVGGALSADIANKGSSMEDIDTLYKQFKRLIGSDSGAAERKKRLDTADRQALSRAGIAAGLRTIVEAAQHPTQGTAANIATGGISALEDYDKAAAERATQRQALENREYDTNYNLAGLSIQEQRAQARANTSNALMREQIRSQNNPALIREQSIHNLAISRMQQAGVSQADARKKYPEYHLLATQDYSDRLQAAGVVDATRQRGIYEKAKKDFYAMNSTTVRFPTFEEWAAQGGTAPTEIRE